MSLSDLLVKGSKLIKANAPEILTALGVSGVVTTSYLVAKASFKAAKKIEEAELDSYKGEPKQRQKDRVKLVWQFYIPAAVSGVATVGCIICSSKASGRRTAAAVTAYSLTERAFAEYKDKVVEQIGKNKELALRDDIAQEKVTALPPSGREVLIVGKGDVLCFDSRSVRYFKSSMEELKRAENDINFQINHERFVSLSEFYIAIGLPVTKESVYNGWSLDRGLMELDISTTISEDEQPCFVIDFNYCMPIADKATPDSPICEW